MTTEIVMHKFLLRTTTVFCLIFLAIGCGRESTRGQLMVRLTSQVPMPKDIARISIETRFGGVRQGYDSFAVDSTKGSPLPVTMAVIQGTMPGKPVRVLVSGWDRNGVLRVVREVTTTVPLSRVADLTVEMDWACFDKVSDKSVLERDVELQKVDSPRSDCANDGETCILGRCVSDAIDSETLPDFIKDATATTNGACFDVNKCFPAGGGVEIISKDPCQIDPLQGGIGINLALWLPEGSSLGFCTPDRCLIPLNGYSPLGWTQAGGRLQLPLEVCSLITAGRVLRVAVSTLCPTKTASIGACDVMP